MKQNSRNNSYNRPRRRISPLLRQYLQHKQDIDTALKTMPRNAVRRKNIEIEVSYLLKDIEPYIIQRSPLLIEYAADKIRLLKQLADVV